MLYRVGLIIALVGSSLIFWPDFADAFGLIKIVPALIGVLLMALSVRRFQPTPIDRPLTACLLALILSLHFSVDWLLGVNGVYSQPFHGLVALVPVIWLFDLTAGEAERWPRGPFIAAAAVLLVQGVVCAAQLGGLYPERLAIVSGRAMGTMGSPIFLGAILATCLPAAIWLGARGSFFGGFAAIGGFLALAASGSRGPWLAALAGLWGYLAAARRISPRWGHMAALAAALAGLLAVSWRMGKADSDSGRLGTWRVAARVGLERPLTGWGPDTFLLALRQAKPPDRNWLSRLTVQASAHNDLLQAWATTGILGLAAYSWLWLALLTSLWRLSRWDETEATAAVFGSMLALFVVAKFNPVPPSALYLAAGMAGIVLADLPVVIYEDSIVVPSRVRSLIIFGVAMTFLVSCVYRLTSEFQHSYGVIDIVINKNTRRGADGLRRANEINPTEITYAAKRCELLFRLSDGHEYDKRIDFAKRALRAAGGVVKFHPNDPAAYELLGTTELWYATTIGKLELARASIRSSKRALELDPHSEFSYNRWMQAANILDDKNEMRTAIKQLEEVRAGRL